MLKRTLPLIVGNWKATPKTQKEALTFIKQLEKKASHAKYKKLPKKSYFLAVPEIFIPTLAELADHGYIGAQTIHGTVLGQITGGSTPSQLISGGAAFAIVGHSEVRKKGETGEERNEKVKAALLLLLPTILCIGEQKRDKEGRYLEELESDIKNTLKDVPREAFKNLIIAYEPVWAIGQAVPATPHECFEAVIGIRRALAALSGIEYAKKVHILYGGAVTQDSAKTFIEEGGVDGLLIGRASQDVTAFFDIITTLHG